MATQTILVVDDDPDIAEYFESFLGDHGYEVVSAGSASAALAALDTCTPDAILIDVLLPGRSGLNLLVTLRRDPRWGETPLVVVTGNDSILQDDCQSYLGTHEEVRGPDGVLGKPVDRKVLLAVLAKLCGDNDRG